MPEPLKTAALRGLGEPSGAFLVVDPGGRTGFASVVPAHAHLPYVVCSLALDELPAELRACLHDVGQRIEFVVCEDFRLLSGKARQQSGSTMPAPIGIGMVRTACEWTDTPLYLAPPNIKRAGHQALDAAGRAAYDACRNDHEHDVVDIAGFVLREMRRPA